MLPRSGFPSFDCMTGLVNVPTGAILLLADSWDMHDWGNGAWVVMMVGMLLFWTLIALLIVWVVRSRDVGGSIGGDDPLRVLDGRLARGEISIEEYERRRALIQKR